MNITVLLDLDDTLLTNDIDSFLPPYLKLLGNAIKIAPAENVIHHVLEATEKMVLNQNPGQSLEDVFDQWFYPGIGISKQDLAQTIQDFYQNEFPKLRDVTKPRPEAISMVKTLFQRGYQVVVATNPLFPKTAILQRLAWADLPIEDNPFSLISTYENFHFAKPNPAYYAEILAHLGWRNQRAVMIGNSYAYDILPAIQLGIPCFWLGGDATEIPQDQSGLIGTGEVSEVIPWIEANQHNRFEFEFTSPTSILAVLRSTPAALNTFGKNIPQEAWNLRPENEEWSFTEILCHLRDVDREVNLPRLEKICREDNPFLPGIDTDPWAVERNYYLQDGKDALQGFTSIRSRLLDLLSTMEDDRWKCPARHAIFGPTNVQELVSFITTHDRSHVNQSYTTLKSIDVKI